MEQEYNKKVKGKGNVNKNKKANKNKIIRNIKGHITHT